MRILCVCLNGNSRSVGCAFVLKKYYKIDALACGVRSSAPETLRMLLDWADHVLVMEHKLLEKFLKKVPCSADDLEKLKLADVGSDRYLKHFHPELVAQCAAHIKRLLPLK